MVEGGGLEGAIGRIGRLAGEQGRQLLQGPFRLAAALEHGGVVVARGLETGRELEATGQQTLGVLVAAQPRADFAQHAQGGRVGGVGFEELPQAALRMGKAPFDQVGGGGLQVRIAHRGLDLASGGRLGARIIAGHGPLFREQAPGVGEVRLEGHGPLQRGGGLPSPAQQAQGGAQVHVHDRGARLGHRQRFEQRQGAGRVALLAPGPGQQQDGLRMAGDRLEDFPRLGLGQGRVAGQQPHGVGQGGLDGADGRLGLGGQGAARGMRMGQSEARRVRLVKPARLSARHAWRPGRRGCPRGRACRAGRETGSAPTRR